MANLASFIPVLGPIIAAAITAVVAFVVSVLAKENKTSEFRQAWIEALRTDVAELLGSFNTLEISLRIHIDSIPPDIQMETWVDKFLMENRKDYASIDSLCNKVVLRLNPVEHLPLITKIRHLEESVGAGAERSHKISVDVVQAFSKLLKEEWNRVKLGEPIFRRLKTASLVIAIITLLGSAAVIVRAAYY
jgi:hypothetical protein